MQALVARPAMNTWHVAQSPFLQEYFGFMPIAGRAFESGEPGLKFFFFPLYDKTVIVRLDDLWTAEACLFRLRNP